MVCFITSALHQQGSAVMSPISSSSHKVKTSVSASLFIMNEGLAECEWISGVLDSAVYHDYEPSSHRRKSISLPVEPTVTVMKADNHLQIDPSTVCVIDAKSAFDHLVRESTGGHCRRTAQELCVIRRSMQTLRARCRWVPHERMVVDALTKRHGNSVTMLRLLRDGVLSIVDEDRELATRNVYRETHKRNLRPHQQVEQAQTGEYDRRNAVGCSHTIKTDESGGGVRWLEYFPSLVEARCSSAFFLGHVVNPCLSSSSDDHPLFHSCLGTGMRVGSQSKFCHFPPSLVHSVSAIVLISLSVC